MKKITLFSVLPLFLVIFAFNRLNAQVTVANNTDCDITAYGQWTYSLSACLIGPYYTSATVTIPARSVANVWGGPRIGLLGPAFIDLTVIAGTGQVLYLNDCNGPTLLSYQDCTLQSVILEMVSNSFCAIDY